MITAFEWPIGSFPDKETKRFQVKWPTAEMQVAAFEGGELQFNGTLEGTMRVFRNQDEAHMRIEAGVEAMQLCIRCLEPAPLWLEIAFDILYRPSRFKPNYWEDESDIGLGYYDDGKIHLQDDLRRHLQLETPLWPVCQESCKGICPECGVNRNETLCGCGNAAQPSKTAIGAQLERLFNR